MDQKSEGIENKEQKWESRIRGMEEYRECNK